VRDGVRGDSDNFFLFVLVAYFHIPLVHRDDNDKTHVNYL
jgi:hypothetical protein